MTIKPNKGQKKDPKVSKKDSIPIWLKRVSQKIPIKNPIIEIMKLEFLRVSLFGIKFISEYWAGIKFATRLVDIDAVIIKNRAITVTWRLSNLPIISVGFVKILSKSSTLRFKKASAPTTIKTEKKEKTIKLKSKRKFPFFKSFSSLTYLEKSQKLIMMIEK